MTLAPSTPASPGAPLRYEDALRRYAAERLPEARVSRILSRLRLLTFLPGAASAAWALTRRPDGATPRCRGGPLRDLRGARRLARASRGSHRVARRAEPRQPARNCPDRVEIGDSCPEATLRRVLPGARSRAIHTPAIWISSDARRFFNGWARRRRQWARAGSRNGFSRPVPREEIGERQEAVEALAPLDRMARTPGRTRPPLGEGAPRGDRSLPGMGRGSTAPRQMAASPATHGARPDRQHLVSSGSLRDRHRRGGALARSSGARSRALVCAVLAHSQMAGSRWRRAARTRAL